MLSTWESKVKCKTCGYGFCVDSTQWNCKYQTGGKKTGNVSSWDIVNYKTVGFGHVMVQHEHGMEGQPFAMN